MGAAAVHLWRSRAALSAPPSSTKLPGIEMRSLGSWKAGPLSTESSQQSFNLHYYCFCFWDKISYNQAVFELAESDLGFQMKNFWSSCLCCGVRCDTHLICGCWKLNPGCHACQASISQLSHSLSCVLACVKMRCYIIFNQWRNALVF